MQMDESGECLLESITKRHCARLVDTFRKVTEVNSMVDDATAEIGPLKERSLYSNWSGTFAEKV